MTALCSFSIGRMILTKKPWIYDPNGDRDRDDVTYQYKNKEGTEGHGTTACFKVYSPLPRGTVGSGLRFEYRTVDTNI